VLSFLAGALRLASIALCLIALASFGLFALNQTSSASAHQQEELNGGPSPASTTSAPSAAQPSPHGSKGSLRRTIDDASEAITSPFSAVTSGSSSQWVVRAVDLLLALAVYGFGLGFIARVIRVRV